MGVYVRPDTFVLRDPPSPPAIHVPRDIFVEKDARRLRSVLQKPIRMRPDPLHASLVPRAMSARRVASIRNSFPPHLRRQSPPHLRRQSPPSLQRQSPPSLRRQSPLSLRRQCPPCLRQNHQNRKRQNRNLRNRKHQNRNLLSR